MPGGAATYVTALLADCTAVTLRLGTGVERLTREAEGWRVWTSDGTEQSFDQVVVATPAEVAGQLLRGADHPLADTVAGLKHFDTDIVVHRDFRLMPPERDAWSVINVRYDGHHAGRPNGPTATSPSTSSGPGCPPAIVCRWARSTGASFGT